MMSRWISLVPPYTVDTTLCRSRRSLHLMRSAGRAYPWVELAVVDPATGAPLPAGGVGEVRIRSDQVTAGYWRRPDETRAAFGDDGSLRTGDAGYLDPECYLFLTDRIKDMIVTGTEIVYPFEVESVLSEHPDIADVDHRLSPWSRGGATHVTDPSARRDKRLAWPEFR